MVQNATSFGDTATSGSAQQVSGASLFWALAALAINAMTQQSFCGYLWSGRNFEDSLWPHRSSPFTCLLDSAADGYLLYKAWRERSRKDPRGHTAIAISSDNNEAGRPATPPTVSMGLDVTDDDEPERPVRPSAVTTRLAIFVLGVLPQVIKLTSMRGIPVTQAIAAVFFVTSLVSWARTLKQDPSNDQMANFASTWSSRNQSFYKITRTISWLLNAHALVLVWVCIVGEAKIVLPEQITDLIAEIKNLLLWLCSAYLVQHMACFVIWGRPRLPRAPVGLMWIGFMAGLIFEKDQTKDSVTSPKDWLPPPPRKMVLYEQVFGLMSCTFLISLVFASLLDLCARILLRHGSPKGDIQESRAQADTAAHQSVGIPSTAYQDEVVSQPHPAHQNTGAVSADAHTINPVIAGAVPSMRQAEPSQQRPLQRDEFQPLRREESKPPRSLRSWASDPKALVTTLLWWIAVKIGVMILMLVMFTLPHGRSNEQREESRTEANRVGSRPAANPNVGRPSSPSCHDATTQPHAAYHNPHTASHAAAHTDGPVTSGAVPVVPPKAPSQQLPMESNDFHWPRFPRSWASNPKKVVVTLLECFGIFVGRLLFAPFTFDRSTAPLYPGEMGSRDSRLQEVWWMAFVIFNVITAVVYYLVVFDGVGTANPRWTTVLG